MKRNTTPPLTQPSLFVTENTTAILSPPKTPRTRVAVKSVSAAVPVPTTPKTADAKIVKTNPAPKPAAKATSPGKPAVVPKAANPTRVTAKPAGPVKTPSPAKATPVTVTVGSAKPKIVKTNPRPKTTTSLTQTVRVVNEPVFEGGMLWKMSGRNGVAYIKDAALAGELLAIDPKKLAQAAMAVYYDKKGKAFAWQVRFDTDRWDEVMRRLA